MNLNKEIRSQLFESVMRDQFKDEMAAIDQTIKEKCDKYLSKKDNGFSAAVMKLKNEMETIGSVTGTQNFNLYGKWEAGYKVMCPFKDHEVVSIQRNVDLSRTYVCAYAHIGTSGIKEHLEVEIEKAKNIIFEAREVSRNIRDVLLSVRTINQLEKITKIFTPFIPKPKVKANMVPLEAITALNKLKSPKTKR